MNPSFRTARRRVLALAGCALAAACHSTATPTPQRPTFSTDASLTSPGTFELEAGAVVDPGDSQSVPATLKYGLNSQTELFVGLPVYQRVEGAGPDEEGSGDPLLGARLKLADFQDGSGLALTLGTKLPTADTGSGFSSGELDFLGALAWSRSFESGLGVTAYYQLDALGKPEGPGARVAHSFALAVGRSLAEDVSIFGELVHSAREDEGDPTTALLGFAFVAAPNVILDVAALTGLNEDAPDLVLSFGATINFGAFAELVTD